MRLASPALATVCASSLLSAPQPLLDSRSCHARAAASQRLLTYSIRLPILPDQLILSVDVPFVHCFRNRSIATTLARDLSFPPARYGHATDWYLRTSTSTYRGRYFPLVVWTCTSRISCANSLEERYPSVTSSTSHAYETDRVSVPKNSLMVACQRLGHQAPCRTSLNSISSARNVSILHSSFCGVV